MKKFKLVLLTSLSVFSAHSMAHAAQWGKVEVTPVVNVSERYDSNVTFAHNAVDDFITLLDLGLTSRFEDRTQSMKLSTFIHPEVYSKNSNFNTVSEDISGAYKLNISKFDHFYLRDSFVHAEQPRSFEDQFGRADGRYDYIKNEFRTSWAHDFTPRFSLQLKYAQNLFDPSRNDLRSTIQHKPGIEADYAISTKTITSLYYDYTIRGYDPGGTTTKNTTGVGIRQFLTSKVYLDASVGVDYIKPNDMKAYAKPVYLIGITEKRDDDNFYGISFLKQYTDTAFNPDIFNSWRIMINWQKALNRRLNFGFNAFTGGGKFQTTGLKEKLNGGGLSFTYAITPKIDSTASYDYTQNDFDISALSYKKSVVSLKVTIKF